MEHFERHWWWDRVFIYVGRMGHNKGIDTIVKAWIRLAESQKEGCPHLWLVGGEPLEIDQVRADLSGLSKMASYEAIGQIRWWGYLDSAGISALLTRALVVVAHSRYEPGGRVVLEAMTEGIPVIATPHGFAAELITDWHNGFLVEFGNEDALLTRMEHFVKQPLLCPMLGHAAKESAQQALNTWRFLDTHCEVYDSAINNTHFRTQKPALSHEDKDPASALHGRRVPSVYPLTQSEPSTEQVVEFFERSSGTTSKNIEMLQKEGSSLRWRIFTSKKAWLVKWPYQRISLRPLWDTIYHGPLFSSSTDRTNAEWFAGRLQGMARWHSRDEKQNLLLRPFEQAITAPQRPSDLLPLLHSFKKLASASPGKVANALAFIDRNWINAPQNAVRKALHNISDCLVAQSEPWDAFRLVSLRLSWRALELALEEHDNGTIRKWKRRNSDSIIRSQRHAGVESSFPLGISHGSADYNHCLVLKDGSILLIDGEHVHPAWPGEDIASIIISVLDALHLDRTDETSFWMEILNAAAESKSEARLIISWASYLTTTDLLRARILLHLRLFARYQIRFELLSDIACHYEP